MGEPGPPYTPRFETRRIALWAVPRSVSTAFERIFIERDDAEVLHEPFSYAYYHGPDRQSDRFADAEPAQEHAYDRVRARILGADDAPVLFIKDMAYQALPLHAAEFYAALTNTFLIREPRDALTSLHRMWPDFEVEEAGYAEQAQLFDLVTQDLAQPPVVLDADDFRRDPEGVVRAYCAAVGIPFIEQALSWERREMEAWRPWAEWHREAEASSASSRRPPRPRRIRRARSKR